MSSDASIFSPASSGTRAKLRERIEADTLAFRKGGRKRGGDPAAARAADRAVGDVLCTDDLKLAAEVRALGFDAKTARLLDLLPLICVAWADGKIQRGERAQIFRVLRVRGESAGSPGWMLFETLLEERPSETYLAACKDLLARLLSQRGATAANVVSMCIDIAEASGGILGLTSAVDANERRVLGEIASILGSDAEAELLRRLGQRS